MTRCRSWSFVWPGRVVVQPLSNGVAFTPSTQRQVLPVGCVLAAEAFAAQLRVTVESGASFRVIFGEPGVPASPSSPMLWVPAPRLCVSDPDRGLAKIYESAFTEDVSGPGSWRVAPVVARARHHVEQRLESDSDLEELSAVTGVDRCYLCRVFRLSLGLPPYRYRAHLRVARARVMLAAGSDCTEAAHSVGFYDQSHLSRCFKELTGTTPGSYARACAGRTRPVPSSPASARHRYRDLILEERAPGIAVATPEVGQADERQSHA